jgi:hypothetical protein
MPEIYHLIRELMLPPCLAIVFIKVGIRTIDDFKRYFDYDVDDDESAKMEEQIDFLLRPYRALNELRSDFSLPVTINRIVSLFRPREPEDEEDVEVGEDGEENEEDD